ncbi:MAG: hypothetical protein ACK56R_11440, partial [Pirellulaceae bacterium]
LVLVLETRWDSNSVHWSVSFRKWLRSTIGIAAVQTAIEYEYRFTEYEYRFTEYEEIGSEVRCSCYWVEEVLRALREPRRNVPDGARKSRAADSSSAGIHPGGVRIDRIHRWVRPGKANRRLAVFRWNPSVLSFITIW